MSHRDTVVPLQGKFRSNRTTHESRLAWNHRQRGPAPFNTPRNHDRGTNLRDFHFTLTNCTLRRHTDYDPLGSLLKVTTRL